MTRSCTACGTSATDADAAFCAYCAAPLSPSPGTSSGGTASGEARSGEARNWASGAHLSALVALVGVPSFLGPLVVWLMRRGQDPFTDEHAREALNFNLSVLLYVVIGGLGAVLIGLATFGVALLALVPLLALGGLAWLILTVVAAVKANNGQAYRYPLTIRFFNH